MVGVIEGRELLSYRHFSVPSHKQVDVAVGLMLGGHLAAEDFSLTCKV
jgi:hypothetical protein